MLENCQKKFKEEVEKQKAETEDYQNFVSEGYDDIINKLKKLFKSKSVHKLIEITLE